METQFNKVDLTISQYGEFTFEKNEENGNYAQVKLPFETENMKSVVDVVNFFNSGLPEGFTVTLVNEEKGTFNMETPAGDNDFEVKFSKRGIRFTRLYVGGGGYLGGNLESFEAYSQERKVITLLQSFYKYFWKQELFAKLVKDKLGLDADEIREERDYWGQDGKKRYVVDSYIIEVDKDFNGKFIGKKIYDDYGYSEIRTISSIDNEIQFLERKRQELLDVEAKFNFK